MDIAQVEDVAFPTSLDPRQKETLKGGDNIAA